MDRNRNTFPAGLASDGTEGIAGECPVRRTVQKDHRAVEVFIKGKELKKYNLSLFRSLTVTNAPAVFREMETLVCKDAESAVDKEVGTIGNRLYYGFYCFPEQEGTFRYLFYRNTSVKRERDQQPEATVVYMEGQVTLEELKQLFQ